MHDLRDLPTTMAPTSRANIEAFDGLLNSLMELREGSMSSGEDQRSTYDNVMQELLSQREKEFALKADNYEERNA